MVIISNSAENRIPVQILWFLKNHLFDLGRILWKCLLPVQKEKLTISKNEKNQPVPIATQGWDQGQHYVFKTGGGLLILVRQNFVNIFLYCSQNSQILKKVLYDFYLRGDFTKFFAKR